MSSVGFSPRASNEKRKVHPVLGRLEYKALIGWVGKCHVNSHSVEIQLDIDDEALHCAAAIFEKILSVQELQRVNRAILETLFARYSRDCDNPVDERGFLQSLSLCSV